MPDAIDVSVIVPFRDAEAHLARCIEGVLAQEYPADRIELLFVDDGSRDGSPALVRRHPRIRLLHEPRRGAYAARNRALREARGRLLAFTDGDCAPRPAWLRHLVDAMRDPDALIVMGPARAAARTRPGRLLARYDQIREAHALSGTDPAMYHGHTNNLITRREVLDAVGSFDERRRGADTLFVQRVIAAHGTSAVRYRPDAVVDHLEVDRARVWLRKMFLYGRSSRFHAGTAAADAPRAARRLRLYRAAVREGDLTTGDAALLLGLLATGVLAWHTGRVVAAVAPSVAEPALARAPRAGP